MHRSLVLAIFGALLAGETELYRLKYISYKAVSSYVLVAYYFSQVEPVRHHACLMVQ